MAKNYSSEAAYLNLFFTPGCSKFRILHVCNLEIAFWHDIGTLTVVWMHEKKEKERRKTYDWEATSHFALHLWNFDKNGIGFYISANNDILLNIEYLIS